jgi:hypothetical protein
LFGDNNDTADPENKSAKRRQEIRMQIRAAIESGDLDNITLQSKKQKDEKRQQQDIEDHGKYI